ncbi:hypothetical protein BJ742DRAFT_322276 [Cladochytrium replicatum]|nr:hypothetical protein BJ742DRAFT_322276 [Cladochytrium replicatum]
MLPLIVRDAIVYVEPLHAMDAYEALPGACGDVLCSVESKPNHTLVNELFKEKLQREIVAALVEQGVIEPNKIFSGRGDRSGERLGGWKVSDVVF